MTTTPTPTPAPEPVLNLIGVSGRWSIAREIIREYLMLGGLFNPEFMEHEKVRNLLMDIADLIDGDTLSPNGMVAKRIDAMSAGKKDGA